jgi:hypothetical protein
MCYVLFFYTRGYQQNKTDGPVHLQSQADERGHHQREQEDHPGRLLSTRLLDGNRKFSATLYAGGVFACLCLCFADGRYAMWIARATVSSSTVYIGLCI